MQEKNIHEVIMKRYTDLSKASDESTHHKLTW